MANMSNEKRLKLLILGVGIIMLFLVITFASSQYTKSSQFCGSCHAIEAQYKSWQQSSHSNIDCIRCHYTPGIFKILGDSEWPRKTVQFTTQLWERPVKIINPIENEVCLRCHTEGREATPSGDLIIPHDRHQEKNVRCIACHQGLVHGEKPDVEVIKAKEFSDKPHHLQSLPKTNMNGCLECHVEKKITIDCAACHTDIVIPPSHKEPKFDVNHGKQAWEDVNGCNNCHSYTFSEEGVETEEDKVKKYARGNVFCYDCHMKRPEDHKRDWLDKHVSLGKNNRDGCLVCHNEDRPQAGEKVTKTACNQCHGDAHHSGWKKVHPSTVKKEGTAKNKCFNCHSQNQCFTCHTGRR